MINQIQKYDFKEGLPHELELLDLDYLINDFYEEIIQPHRAEFYQIIWFQKGYPVHQLDFNSISIEPNTLLFVNKNCVQFFDSETQFTGKSLLFTENFFCQTEKDTKFLKSTILFNDLLSISKINLSDDSNDIQLIFNQLETEITKPKDPFQPDILHNLLKNLLLFSERERRNQDFVALKNDENLIYATRFKDLIEEYFIEHKTVSFYTEQLHISSKKLNLVTQKIMGKSPKNIIIERVVLEAKRLLSYTNNSIKEIAFLLGFEESTNFVKFFKKHTHHTPEVFRNSFFRV